MDTAPCACCSHMRANVPMLHSRLAVAKGLRPLHSPRHSGHLSPRPGLSVAGSTGVGRRDRAGQGQRRAQGLASAKPCGKAWGHAADHVHSSARWSLPRCSPVTDAPVVLWNWRVWFL